MVTALVLAVSAILVLLTGLIRSAGASLVRTPRADALHDAAEDDQRAARVAELLEERAGIQPALGMVHTVLMVPAAILASWALSRLISGGKLFAGLLALAVLLVLFGDLLPRSFGRRRPGDLAYRFAWVLSPAIASGAAAADLISNLDELDVDDADPTDVAEKELISSVLDFTDTLVREVMVPRPDMITVAALQSSTVARDILLEAGKSRIPVTGDGMDNIEGVVYGRDLLRLMDDGVAEMPLRDLMRPAYFVPETKRVSELLREMQSNQIHLAVVVDEFGGTAGLVTIEDLLEELVGEIVDEYDDEAPMVTALADHAYLVDARMGVDELGELLGTELPAEDWDTVGGLVMGLAGRVPKEGETFELNGHTLTAHRVQGRRVATVRVHLR